MKINFTLFGSRLTGGTFNVIEAANCLAERGHDVSVTTIGEPADLSWFRRRTVPKFKEYYAPFTSKIWYRLIRRSLRGTKLFPMPEIEIRDLVSVMPDCDVNVATAAPTAFAVHRSGRGRGFYYIQHYDSLFGQDPLANRLHDESYFLPLRKITVSSWLKDIIKEKLNVSVESVITAGINEEVFYPRPRSKNKKLRVVSLGRKVAWKGFPELESAMKNLFKKRNDLEWIVYSSHDVPEPSPEAPFILVKSPYGKDLAELYASSDIAVNPSWHEGFAQPALEAMACGAAVVTTPVGAEDFAEAGKNCSIVEPKNPGRLEESIERLLDDNGLREKLVQGGLKTAKDFYWDKIVDKWEKVLKQ